MTSIKFTAEELAKSKDFSNYQPDFIRAILGGKEYTKAEAKKLLESFFNKKGRE